MAYEFIIHFSWIKQLLYKINKALKNVLHIANKPEEKSSINKIINNYKKYNLLNWIYVQFY